MPSAGLLRSTNAGPSNEFINEVADWLLAIRDPRLSFTGKRPKINDLAGASADFCRYMAEVCEAGYEAKDWRLHFEVLEPKPAKNIP